MPCARIGRGETPLARLSGRVPLVDGRHIALVGRRDAAQPWYGHGALAASAILDLPDSELLAHDLGEVAAASLARVAADGLEGFWIQLDADALNPAVMPAVDSPEPGGLMPGELVEFLTLLVRHRLALGLSVTTYDPALDADRSGARQLVRLLETLLNPKLTWVEHDVARTLSGPRGEPGKARPAIDHPFK